MIKVLQVGSTNVLGGIENYLHNYYVNINKKDVQFDFVNMYDKICFQDEYIKCGSKVFELINYRKHPLRYIKQLKKILKDENYDILHFNMNSAVFLYPLIAAKIAKTPIIIAHSHNASSDKGFIKQLLHNIFKRLIPVFANTYFSCSDYAAKWFFSKNIRKNKNFFIINNGVDTKKFIYNDSIRKKIRSKLKLSDNDIVIGHVGRFIKQKNQDFIIEILNECYKKENNQNYKLILIGKGELENRIKNKVKEFALENNVYFLGQLNDVNNYYQAFDIFVLPSLYEGLPLVGIEAQISGCYCIFSDKITRMLKISDNCEFVTIEDPNKWADLVTDNKLMKKIRMSPLNHKDYDIKNNANKLIEIYTKLLNEIM